MLARGCDSLRAAQTTDMLKRHLAKIAIWSLATAGEPLHLFTQ